MKRISVPRTAGELAGAALATGILYLDRLRPLLPLAADDPFRSTLVVLPLVVAALRAIERLACHDGGRRLARGSCRLTIGHLEAVALGLLVLLILGRRGLGLAVTDWFLAAGFVLLLAHRVARLVVGLRPALGRRVPARPSWAFFLLPLVVYLAIQPWSGEHRQPDGDEPYYLLLTHSLVHDFDVRLGNNYAGRDWEHFMQRPIAPQPGDPEDADGEIYSRHNLLLPLVLVPGYLVAGRWGALATMAVVTAALAWMVMRLAHHYAPQRPTGALLAWGLLAFSPPLLLYSYQVWIEVPAALLLAVALDRLLILRRRSPLRPVEVLGLIVPLVLLPLLKLRLGLLAIPLVFLAWRRIRPGRAVMLAVAGGLALALGGLFLHNYLRYGNFLKIHSLGELGIFSYPLQDYVRGAVGMFYDVAFGLFPNSPIWLLLLPAGWLLVRRRDPLLTDLLVLSLPYLLLLAPRPEWYGGWSPPFRYGVVFLPLLALTLVPLFELRRRPGLRGLLAALGGLTVILTVMWVVRPGWTYNFADGRTHLLDQAGGRLAADVAQLFPSAVRPRPATWIWPLASLLLIPTALWPQRGRVRRPAWWGVVAVLLLLAAVPWAATHLPTRIVELEDGYVTKYGGWAFPEPWVTMRPSYRSGWVLPPAGRLVAPVVAGGETVRLRLAARVVGSGERVRLQIAAGDTHLATWQIEAGSWQEVELGPFAWPAGEPLVIRGTPRAPAAERGRVVVDRAELRWQ